MIAPQGEGKACACLMEALIERARQGDAKALDEFFAWLWPRIRARLVRRTKRRQAAIADVEDATQEACLRTMFRLARWPSKDLLHQSALIGRHELARIRALRHRRGKTLFLSELSLETTESLTLTVARSELDPAHIAQEQEEAARAIAVLQELTLRDSRILWTVCGEGQSTRQCSRAVDVAETTVRHVITAGLAWMKRRLNADR